MPTQTALPIGCLDEGPLPEATFLRDGVPVGFFSQLIRPAFDEYRPDRRKHRLR